MFIDVKERWYKHKLAPERDIQSQYTDGKTLHAITKKINRK